MSKVFAMKGSTARTFHGAHSAKPLDIRGKFQIQGPQPVDEKGGVPGWAADLFDSMPQIKTIALSGDMGGVVWTRTEKSDQHALDEIGRA